MAMVLDQVVPFGRSLDEYCQMFNLTAADRQRQIIGVGDGPASFNAEMHQLGNRVISVDPIYQFSATEIQQRFDAVVDGIIDQVKRTPDDWVWRYHRSPEDLRQNRIRALQQFLQDYEIGRQEQRYILAELPELAFADDQFDLALCSHLLFLYSDQFSTDFHLRSILEMLRIAPESRIFPLLTLMGQRSPHLDPVITQLQAAGYAVQIETVPYELQRGGNQMLVVRRPAQV